MYFYVPDFLLSRYTSNLVVVFAQVVDDILITDINHRAMLFISSFNDRFKLGSVAAGPGQLRLYGLNKVQGSDFSSMINVDDKLSALETCPFKRTDCILSKDSLTPVQKSSFNSVNSSLGWRGNFSSPLCTLNIRICNTGQRKKRKMYNSFQSSCLRVLKRLGTSTHYPRRLNFEDCIV